MSKPSPETIAIIAVGATLLIAVCSVGIGLGMLWSSGQARTDRTITEWQTRTDGTITEWQARTDRRITEWQARTDRRITEWQARTDAAIAELRHDVGELRRDVQDVRDRLTRLEGAILAQLEPGAGAADG